MAVSDAKRIIDTLSPKEKRGATYANGTVMSVKGNVAYVNIEGGAQKTPCQLAMSAKVGDKVKISIIDHTASITGNYTTPATGDAEAIAARRKADAAFDSAMEAYGSAQTAAAAATAATASAGRAAAAAVTAEQRAAAAEGYANDALTEAQNAKTAADTAQGEANKAANSASDAAGSANEASIQAKNAGDAASAALGRLSDIENVVGAFDWIQTHAHEYVSAAGTDFDSTKMYYGYDSSLDTYYRISNPVPENVSSYYILNIEESVQQYIAAHASMTDDGLWLIGDSSQYKVLVSSGSGNYDAGMHVISNGRVVASYGETTIIGDASKAHIEISDTNVSFKTADGSEVAYIAVDEVSGESMFYMTRAVVVKDLRFGYWKWADRSNRNMALKWMGE